MAVSAEVSTVKAIPGKEFLSVLYLQETTYDYSQVFLFVTFILVKAL